MKNGCIYILTNKAFEECIKIGYSKNVDERLKQLNKSSAVPYPFRKYATYDVEKELTDKDLHKLIDELDAELRVQEDFNGKLRKREFYLMSAQKAFTILKCIAKVSNTENRLHLYNKTGEEMKEEELIQTLQNEVKRGPFRFSQCKIKPGEQITFIDDPLITPIIIDDRHIEYNGVTTSLSALAQQLKGFTHPVQGTLWFSYKGERLADLRLRLEKESCK